VTFQNWSRFFSRTSKGNYQLDVGEIRSAFTASETAIDRIRSFKNNRVAQLVANETPIAFEDGAKVILHLIPANAFHPGSRYDVLETYDRAEMLPTLFSSSLTRRINLDGVVWYQAVSGRDLSANYTQIYHNGIIESVSHNILRPRTTAEGEISLLIPSSTFEQKIIQCVNGYIKSYVALDIELPVYVFLTITGAKNYNMAVPSYYYDDSYPIDRDVLLIPEIILEDYNAPVHTIMRPIIDQVWNACGFHGSSNYDDNGNWKVK
jgi:hypothetical protein